MKQLRGIGPEMTSYDNIFFEYVNAGARRSALSIVPIVQGHFSIDSVLDVGCGQGAWLAVWREKGTRVIRGVDGDYVDRRRLLIDEHCFRPHDLSTPFDLGCRFDLVQSLEVAEHLPEHSAASFVDSLVRHSDLVLFSAAPRGQGGDHHVNEQSYEYWRRHFARHGYRPIDLVRPCVKQDASVEPWYRYNVLLYASPPSFQNLRDEIRVFAVPEHQSILDVSPLPYRLRKQLIGLLPVPMVTKLAKWKERRVVRKLALTR